MSAVTGIKRLVVAVGAVLALGFGFLLVLLHFIPADAVRDQVKAHIREVTGLDPVLSGDVSVSLFPTSRVRFADVSFGDKRSGTSALTTEELVVRLRFFPLLIGRVELADVTLVRPTIAIAFTPSGGSNWSPHVEALARALKPSPDRVKSFSEIRITAGTVMLHDETFKTVETLTNVEFALAWPSISKSFAATGRFTWHDETIDATLSLTDFVAALSGERSGLKLRLSGAPLKFAFDGNVSYLPTFKADGMLAADTASLRDTLGWAASWISPSGGFGRFTLKAQAAIVGRNISLSGVNVELDGNAGEGVLTFAGNERQTLQGTLAAETLDLTPYLSALRLVTSNDWNRRRITLAGLAGFDADLRLSAARVTLANVKLGRTAAAVNLRNGSLSATIGEAHAFGGIVSGSLALADRPAGAELKVQLQFADVDLEQSLGEIIGTRRVEGNGTFAFTLEGSGRSVYEVAQALNGVANLTSKKGALAGMNVEQLLRRLERNPLAGRTDFRSGKTPFDLLAVSFKVTQGIAQVQDVRVEAPTVRLELTGTASIPDRDLDLKGTASLIPAREAPPTFDLPFVVQGHWEDPLIWPDAQALINRSGAAQPLLDAVRNRLKREPGRPTARLPVEPTPPSGVSPQ